MNIWIDFHLYTWNAELCQLATNIIWQNKILMNIYLSQIYIYKNQGGKLTTQLNQNFYPIIKVGTKLLLVY
jgi:hypothetical protein